jgi:light-regulated signal transduction histidine kinase (bacteriophytochrome)
LELPAGVERDVATLQATLCLKEERLRLSEERLRLSEERLSEERLRAAHLELLLSERTEQLSGLRRELEAFTYSVAHDLRAPLRGMHGFAKILLDDHAGTLAADGLDCLHRIQGNAVVMSQLVDGLLALAKVTLGELEPVVVDLSELTRAAFAEHAAREPERKVSLAVQGGLSAWVDRGLARSLFDNLVANAWKFTRKVQHPSIEVGLCQHEGAQAYFVRDNGVGFNMEYANKLFVPFQRLHAPREFPGTAIGLAACHRIVARHGGRIWGEGKVGGGATFFFTLPCAPSLRPGSKARGA